MCRLALVKVSAVASTHQIQTKLTDPYDLVLKKQQIINLNGFRLLLFAWVFFFFTLLLWDFRFDRIGECPSGREECVSALTGELARVHVHAQHGAPLRFE